MFSIESPSLPMPAKILFVWLLLLPVVTASAPDFRFDAAIRTGESMPRLYSMLVNWKGTTVLEKYFNGSGPEKIVNIKSASKSVISALVGIAIAEGHIKNLDQPLVDFFGEEVITEPDKQSIRIRDLLTMQAGLASTSSRNYGAWVQSRDWIAYTLKQPMLAPPGTAMQYSTGNTHLLSAILTRTTGMDTLQYARKTLAEPLGFHLPAWPRDPQGIYFGGNDMELTARQMLAFGQLYLNRGKYKDMQIIPAEWVEHSLQRHASSPREEGRYYGYGWWLEDMAGFETQYAWGYGGQFIVLVPALDLVVVTTSSSHPDPERRAHRRKLDDLIQTHIIRTVAETLQSGPVTQQDY